MARAQKLSAGEVLERALHPTLDALQTVPLDPGGAGGAVATSEVILLPLAARTAGLNTPDQTNYGARGLYLCLVVTVASGTGGLTLRFQGKDPASGTYMNLNAAPTAVIAVGTTQYVIYPGATTLTAVTQATVQGLPRTWRIGISVGDASSYTYSVGGWTLV